MKTIKEKVHAELLKLYKGRSFAARNVYTDDESLSLERIRSAIAALTKEGKLQKTGKGFYAKYTLTKGK